MLAADRVSVALSAAASPQPWPRHLSMFLAALKSRLKTYSAQEHSGIPRLGRLLGGIDLTQTSVSGVRATKIADRLLVLQSWYRGAHKN